MHVGHGQVASRGGARAVADQDGPVLGLAAGRPWLPSDERRVERDHVEEGAEAELLLDQPADAPGPWARASAGRRRARTGRSPACGGCRPCGRSRGPAGRRASTDRRTRRRARRGRPARRTAGGRARLRAAPRPARTRATPGSGARRSRTRVDDPGVCERRRGRAGGRRRRRPGS